MDKNDQTENINYPLPDDWRGEMITRIRKLIKEADPQITEDIKWRTATNPDGNLVWYRNGMITTGEIYKKHLRLGFTKGKILKENDPKGLINSYRAILLKEEDVLDDTAFINIIRDAVELNLNK
jgi:hypothetical protein